MEQSNKVRAWRAAIGIILVSQAIAAIAGSAVTWAAMYGGKVDFIILSAVAVLAASVAVAGGYCGARLAGRSMSAHQ